MADTAQDDWFVPDQKTGKRAAGDDWFVPPEPPKPFLERAEAVVRPPFMRRIEQAVGQGVAAGSAGPGLPEGGEKFGQAIGVLQSPERPFEPTRAITDFAIRGIGRTIGGFVGGVTAGVGQTARELGASETSAEQLQREAGGVIEYELIKPEHGAGAGRLPLSTPEQINSFLRNADTVAPKPTRPSQTRAEIDEFLAQKAAQEAAAGKGPPRLAGPDDWVTPGEPGAPAQPGAAAPAPPQPPPAGGAADAGFSTYEEPGRTAPAYGAPPGYVERTFQVESRAGQAADRPGSQYQGLAQFGAAERARYGITDPTSVEQNTNALVREAEANSRPLTKALGRAPDPGELYLAHQQGLGGAIAQLGNPDRPAWQNLEETAEGRAKGPGWAKQAIWGNLTPSAKARFGSVENVSGADFVNSVKEFYGGAPGRAPIPGAETPAAPPETAAPQPGPHVLKGLMEDERSADQIRQEGFTPPALEQLRPKPSPDQAPDLAAIMQDQRSADQIRADLEAHRNFKPTNEWQPVPPPTHGAPALPPHLEFMHGPNGQPLARIPPPPPPVGTRVNPVAVITPIDVHAGAQLTALPTPAQAEAGNYQKRHIEWHGLDLAIESERGMQRTGVGPGGTPWSTTLQHPYGYIKRTEGADGEQVDFYLGPHPQAPHVYIADQIDPQTGRFDEHKALIGFPSAQAARAGYEAGFSDNSGRARLGDMQRLTVAQFKQWLKEGDLSKPLAYSDPVEAARGIAKDIGVTASDAAIQKAADAVRVSNADPMHAVYSAIDHEALAAGAQAMENARQEGLGDEWTTNPAAEDQARKGLAAPGEQPTETQSAVSPGTPAPRGEAAEAQRAPGAAEPAGAVEPSRISQSVLADHEVQEPPEPELTKPSDLTAARLAKLAKKIPSMSAEERAAARERIDALMAQMEADGKKIAEHCVETGGKFSLRG